MTTSDSLQDNDWMHVRDELRLLIEAAAQRSQPWVAWRKLINFNAQGRPADFVEVQQTLEVFEAIYEADRHNCDVIHHLAVGYHSLAWELENQGAPEADDVWRQALFYWRKLQACQPFWERLMAKDKLGQAPDVQVIETFRRRLLIYQIEIHVEFILHYQSLKQDENVDRHIKIINGASIPPVMRRELEELVYQNYLASLLTAESEGRFEEVLNGLDGFLRMFENYIPALQKYLEVAALWLPQLSPTEDGLQITNLERGVLLVWNRLSESTALSQHSLVPVALYNSAQLLGTKYAARFHNLVALHDSSKPYTLNDEDYFACHRALFWFKKLQAHGLHSTDSVTSMYFALINHAIWQGKIALTSYMPTDATYDTLIENAVNDYEAACQLLPDDPLAPKYAATLLYNSATYRYNHRQPPDNKTLQYIMKEIKLGLKFEPDNVELSMLLAKLTAG